MNLRALQLGFVVGTLLAFYSMETGATGFKSITDCVATGAFMGALVEALWTVLKLQWRMNSVRR